MKDKQGKHDHKLTKLLKFGLFATLMVAPLFAVLFKCMYVTFNKNAYQSYSDNNTEETYINNTNQIDFNTEYYINNAYKNDLVAFSGNAGSNILRFNIIEVIDNPNNYNFNNVIDVGFYSPSTTSSSIGFYFHYSDSSPTINVSSNNTFKLKIQVTSFTSEFSSSLPYMNFLSVYGSSNSLDNAFYYSVNEMQNNSLFNWTTSTAIYTPINAMTSGLGITTDAVAILLTYWLYLTLIYIVIDIVVELFTWMTHTLLGKPLG